MMQHVKEILHTHPKPHSAALDQRAELIATLAECALVCQACADACLAEPKVDMLRDCIATDQLCATICNALALTLVRQTVHDAPVLASLLTACQAACQTCAQECEQHATRHAHCAHCGAMCRECEKSCRRFAEAALIS